MNKSPLDALTQRVAHLERDNRRLKRIGALLVLGLAASMLIGSVLPKSPIIEAETFVLKDGAGRARAILGADPSPGDGGLTLGLFLYGPNGEDRARLATRAGGTELVLYDYDEHITSLASLDATGKSAGLSLDTSPHHPEEPSEGFAELSVGMEGSSFMIGGRIEDRTLTTIGRRL